MVGFLSKLLTPIFEPMGVSAADLTSYLEMVKGYVWVILLALVALIVVLVLAKNAKPGKKHLIRWNAVLAWLAVTALVVNLMCFGPLYTNVSGFLNASKAELTEETALSFQSVARSQGKDFRLSVTPGLNISGDEKAVAKLVSILLDNAMKYSPEGGWVELSLTKAGRFARLSVKNSSLPMETGNADRLFERFTREDRSRNSETGGFGLGLAIAKAVTEAHRGSIHAVSEDGRSLTVTADLPLC